MSGFSSAGSTIKPGTCAFFAASTAPAGWLKCNGAAVSRATYAALFNAIGTTSGAGDGATTFNVPDDRGEFIRCWDDGRGVDSGRVFGSAQTDALKSHTHSIMQNNGGNAGGWGGVYDTSNPAGATGATGGTETRPRNVARLSCIKF